ncbi:uncharacterized protein LOC130219672 [Danio aesculapii]|uniref:uncharacterized protein LOC130219672 n=1 Tax=Danio aesculapii TaxID=1142201 RepID=UPI0024BFE203|nr:uncharacterized protein LOC130219672 [Danio aesculapii]
MTLTKPSLCFTLTLTLHTMFVTAEALDAEALRVLSVGVRGQSSVSIADLLSGNKEQKQKDGEIVKTPVMTDEGRRMTLVTGPNLCEEDTARQNFTTALFLSSPGPHAVLMLLHLEDPQAEPPCDLLQQAQELLGEEVLQYCIVLLQPNQQERLTGASKGIAGDMINACGGRFHIIPDAQTKPAALLEEIDKLVQLNDHRFLSVLTIDLLSVMYNVLGGAVGIGGLFFCISLTAFVVHTEAEIPTLKVCGFVWFMLCLRYFLRPDVAIVLNLALLASLVIVFANEHNLDENVKLESSDKLKFRKILRNLIVCITNQQICLYDELIPFTLLMTLAIVFGSIISIRTWSDVIFACYAAPGVTIGAFAFKFQPNEIDSQLSIYVYALGSFLCCSFGATLSVGFLNVLFALLGVKLTIILVLSLLIVAYFRLNKQALTLTCLIVIMLVFPCVCVLIGSVFLIS